MWNLRLARYAPLPLVDRLRLLIEDSHVNSVTEDRRRLAAVLGGLGLPEGERDAALGELVTLEADARLSWCCQLFKEEAQDMQVNPICAKGLGILLLDASGFPQQ